MIALRDLFTVMKQCASLTDIFVVGATFSVLLNYLRYGLLQVGCSIEVRLLNMRPGQPQQRSGPPA